MISCTFNSNVLLSQLAVDLVKKKEARIGASSHPIISRAGLATNAGTKAAAKLKSDKKPKSIRQ